MRTSVLDVASRHASLFTAVPVAEAIVAENVQKNSAVCISNTSNPLGIQTHPRVYRHLVTFPPYYINSSLYHDLMSSNTSNGKLRKPAPSSRSQQSPLQSFHWLFRSNIPRKRTSYISINPQKRNFFGMGEILGVITNPAETVKSLTESKKLLEEARREISESRERAQIRPKHTFARLPGFFPRKAEMEAIERAMEGEPSFTILFGASSVGKTALLREVLTRPEYHVLHFDLRIAGFADLASLYMSLSQQMEQYFEEISSNMEGYKDFEKEAWSFKHDRLSVERRIIESGSTDSKQSTIKTSDIARLMEMFQSSLLKYWEFQPAEREDEHNGHDKRRQGSTDTQNSNKTRVERAHTPDHESKPKWSFRSWGRSKGNESRQSTIGRNSQQGDKTGPKESEKPKEKLAKKMPVIFFDEAHKLPALIQSTETMKCLLDSMLVLTKQDRLCHVIHATSDPFYQTWLRQLNVMQHCKIITIGDCSKAETRKFFTERILLRVPERMRGSLNFELLYDAFGGKLAHWHDFMTDYINSNGTLDVKQSSHFLQAHALLNLHIIHSSQAATNGGPRTEGDAPVPTNASTAETLHPGLGPAGFKIYSPITHPHGPMSSVVGEGSQSAMGSPPEFSAMELLKVMSRLSRPDTQYLPYFHLCREIGVRAVDGMVKGRVLDLRWTDSVTKEVVEEPRGLTNARVMNLPNGNVHIRDSALASQTAITTMSPTSGHSTYLTPTSGTNEASRIPTEPPPPIDENEDMIPVSDMGMRNGLRADMYEDVVEVIGPKLVPTTPIMRYAMRDVVQEYEDDQSVSEYASLSDIDEY